MLQVFSSSTRNLGVGGEVLRKLELQQVRGTGSTPDSQGTALEEGGRVCGHESWGGPELRPGDLSEMPGQGRDRGDQGDSARTGGRSKASSEGGPAWDLFMCRGTCI